MGKLKQIAIDHAERERLERARTLPDRIREAKIAAHRAAIVGAERQRELMGDAWANETIRYRKAELAKLGVEE
jgi:hypothetical protein